MIFKSGAFDQSDVAGCADVTDATRPLRTISFVLRVTVSAAVRTADIALSMRPMSTKGFSMLFVLCV